MPSAEASNCGVRLAFDNYSAAALFHQRGVADKLQGVAVALFCKEQDGLAIDVPPRPISVGESSAR